MKLWAKWGLKRSEKEIVSFLEYFSEKDPSQSGAIVGAAALLHYQIRGKDPEFEILLNSKKGENHGPIAMQIIQLYRLARQLYKAGQYNEGEAMDLLVTTLRCMSDDSFYHYGVSLWKVASQSFPEARKWLEETIKTVVNDAGDTTNTEKLNIVLGLCDFVPPQFAE